VHDISGDRASDIMWHNVGSGHVAVWNLVGRTVTATYLLIKDPVPTSRKVVGTGDLDGDGFADIVWRDTTGYVASWSLRNGVVAAMQNLRWGNGLPGAGTPATEFDPAWEIRAVGDVDGDGRSDIIWQQSAAGTLGVWFMDGTAVRAVASFTAGMADGNWKIAGAGDLNGDGRADVMWQNHATGELAAWHMDANRVTSSSYLSINKVTDLNWKVRGVGDTNGDGAADLIWQHIGHGGLAVWYLNNFTVIGTDWLSIGSVSDPSWHVVGPG
jgi:hypothetical protein